MNQQSCGRGISLLVALVCGMATRADAQTDEIQVYTGELAAPGQVTLTLHSNYTFSGRTVPDFPGGIVPDHAWNGVPEWAYGVNDWLELGTYLPVYTVTRDGDLKFDSVKIRALFAVPHADDRDFFYGVNLELSYNEPHWEDRRFSGEIRPIIGWRVDKFDFIINPILDTGFNGLSRLDFAPCERVAYNFSKTWAFALEHYSDYGELRDIQPVDQQQHALFAVVDYNAEPLNVEFGVGFGLTHATDNVVSKLMLEYAFN